jgi:hypothetical protein
MACDGIATNGLFLYREYPYYDSWREINVPYRLAFALTEWAALIGTGGLRNLLRMPSPAT